STSLSDPNSPFDFLGGLPVGPQVSPLDDLGLPCIGVEKSRAPSRDIEGGGVSPPTVVGVSPTGKVDVSVGGFPTGFGGGFPHRSLVFERAARAIATACSQVFIRRHSWVGSVPFSMMRR